MSVKDWNTFSGRIRLRLLEELQDEYLVEEWFIRILTISFLKSKNIEGFLIKDYTKENIISLIKKENQVLKGIFKDNIDHLIMNFPNNFFNEKQIEELNEYINTDTKISKIGDFLEDYRDNERFYKFTITNRNIDIEMNESTMSAATQIFTPEMVSNYMIKGTLLQEDYSKKINFKILDPCLGTGNILIIAFERLIQEKHTLNSKLFYQYISNFIECFYGFDIDQTAVTLSKFIFVMKALEYNPLFLDTNYYRLPHFYVIEDSSKYQYTRSSIINTLIDTFSLAKLTGSITNVSNINNIELDKIIGQYSEYKNLYKQFKLLNDKYDVILTNPPYMGRKMMPKELLNYLNTNYPLGKADLYSAFMERLLTMLKPKGYLSMITIHSWMFIKNFTNLRKEILTNYQIESVLHLGKNTFENLNSYNALAAAFIIKNIKPNKPITFIKLTEFDNIFEKEKELNNINNYYLKDSSIFLKVPNNPLIYWINETAYQILLNALKLGSISEIRQGLATSDNSKYIRNWYEVDIDEIGFEYSDILSFHQSNKKYAPYNKGGSQTKWYQSSKQVIKFNKEAYSELLQIGNHLPSRNYYFKEGITWSLFGFNSFNVRYKEKGYVFDVSGSSLFTDKKYLNYILAFLSSDIAFYYLSILAPTVNFQVGNIASLPFIFDETYLDLLDNKVNKLIQLSKEIDESIETSWNFKGHNLLKKTNQSIKDNINDYLNNYNLINNCIMQLEKDINDIFIQIYQFNPNLTQPLIIDKINQKVIIKSLISYIVGIIFKRYLIKEYQSTIDVNDFIDINILSKEVIKIILLYYNEDDIKYIEAILNESIESYLRNHFGKDHIKEYEQLPIYWYKEIDNNIKIGYYHTLTKNIIINKDDGIKKNYLKNNLYLKIK